MSYRSRVRGLLKHAATDGAPELETQLESLKTAALHYAACDGDPFLAVESLRRLVDAAYTLSLAARDLKAIGRPRNPAPCSTSDQPK